MNVTTPQNSTIWNVPNRISAARLGLSAIVFFLIETGHFGSALLLFLIAAGTDWIDGWYARRYDQVTQLGRILDPFCDKILICGCYILLAIAMASIEPAIPWYARVTGMVAVVVIGRELLVTVIRSMVEGGGGDFSANMAGKLKMWFQCIAVASCLITLTYVSQHEWGQTDTSPASENLTAKSLVPGWIWWTTVVSIWLSVWSTLQSGWEYVKAATVWFRSRS